MNAWLKLIVAYCQEEVLLLELEQSTGTFGQGRKR